MKRDRGAILSRAVAALLIPILLSACSPGPWDSLLLEGRELHPSLETPQPDVHPVRHVPRDLLLRNPQHSTAPRFVEMIARRGSQGRLDAEGIRSALYALYLGERELGFYGMEASTEAVADRLETALRETWVHNVSIDRARVHRGGRRLVVVWTDGVASEVWETVNAEVAERMSAP